MRTSLDVVRIVSKSLETNQIVQRLPHHTRDGMLAHHAQNHDLWTPGAHVYHADRSGEARQRLAAQGANSALHVKKLAVQSIRVQQLVVRAALDDFAVMHDQDEVCIAHGR